MDDGCASAVAAEWIGLRQITNEGTERRWCDG